MNILQAQNITKYYGDNVVLQDVSLVLKYGQKMGLMAESGRGKTTLLHILAGLDVDFLGTIYNSVKIKGMVFQDLGLFSHKTVDENIMYPIRLQGGNARKHVLYQDWLELTGLCQYRTYYPHQLSRGMCQKVALIRAFLPNPELVFLDEPTSALDQESKKKIFAFLKCNYKETACIMASHSTWELNQICNSVFELSL